jgi:hypothetical protein
VEVWSRHDEYADVVRLVEVARDLAPGARSSSRHTRAGERTPGRRSRLAAQAPRHEPAPGRAVRAPPWAPALRRLDAVDGGDGMTVTLPDFDTSALLVVDEQPWHH